MTNKNNFTYRKRLNTQIITKTQIALAAIRKHDLEQSRIHLTSAPSTHLLHALDHDFTQLTPHKNIQLEHHYKLNLFPYSQQYYCLQMINYIFPMRILIKHVHNEGTLFIGYDHPYPGVQPNNKMPIFEHYSPDSHKNYDYKVTLNREMLITLKNKANTIVKYVYFNFTAGPSLLMLDFKVQFIGFEKHPKIMSETKYLTSDQSPNKDQNNTLTSNINDSPQINYKQFSRSKPLKLQKLDRNVKLQDFHVMSNQELPRHSSKSNLSPDTKYPSPVKGSSLYLPRSKTHSLRTLKNSKILTMGITKYEKTQTDLKQSEAKRNKQLLEIYKAKDKQLKEIANNCKRMIETYQKIYNEEHLRRKRLNKDITLIIISTLFVHTVNTHTDLKANRDKMQYKVLYLCKRFIKNLKKAHQKNVDSIPFRYRRIMTDATSSIGLQSKILYKHDSNKASKICIETFDVLYPALSVNNMLNVASEYRAKIKLIQRSWKTKYHSRISCLLYFMDNHIEKMMADYPHLKLFQQLIYKTDTNRTLCLAYLKHESEKYRLIHEAYLRTLEEIKDMQRINQSLEKQKSKHKKKPLFVPPPPPKPMHRFYRNLDILKSMVRTWFEIEYKKYIKKTVHPRQK